jgi:hypothetical protein
MRPVQQEGSAAVVAIPVQEPGVPTTTPGTPVAVVRSEQWAIGIKRATQHPLVRLTYGLSSAAAMGVSYSENKSILWALLHGFIGPAYLAYVGWNRYTGKGSKAWYGADAKARVDATVSLPPFQAQSQEQAWETADDLARGLPYSAFEQKFQDDFAYPPDPQVSDIWSEEPPEQSDR